ncbi:aminopeptidase P family protein, partial [Salmonella enterica subsp. enterica]|nr:aminopeptidase P family protein [Salmonella enterica subsp. enterica serovar Enteritidis]
MDAHYRDIRKINPSAGATLADGTPNDLDRTEIGPTVLAFSEWEAAGLTLPNLPRMREYRWARMVAQVQAADYAALLLFDPMNIRYATDSTNMQLWNTHNPFRALLICADGHMVLWDYRNTEFLSDFNPLITERRTGGAGMFYFERGDLIGETADAFAAEIRDILRQHAGDNRKLAVDKVMLHGLRSLEAQGLEVVSGEELCERARVIKGPDDINAMRCASHACEAAVAAMERAAREGVPKGNMSEDDIWAVLHAENIRRGGEWIETRLLTSGPRTNPWFRECGLRIVQNNEIVAFDTDLVGSYGICVDISRTWWIGDQAPPDDMIYAMRHAQEHIATNMELLKPGVSFTELTFGGHTLDPIYQKQKYGCK